MQNGREAALLLLESGMCVRDGNKSNLLIFVSIREIKNEVAISKKKNSFSRIEKKEECDDAAGKEGYVQASSYPAYFEKFKRWILIALLYHTDSTWS